MQLRNEEHVQRNVHDHPRQQGQHEIHVRRVRQIQVGHETNDQWKELPQPLADKPLGTRRRIRDLVDKRSGMSVAEVRRRMFGKVSEQSSIRLGNSASDPAHPAESAGPPDDLVGKVNYRKQQHPSPDGFGTDESIAEGNSVIRQKLQNVGHRSGCRGRYDHCRCCTDHPSTIWFAYGPREFHRFLRDPVSVSLFWHNSKKKDDRVNDRPVKTFYVLDQGPLFFCASMIDRTSFCAVAEPSAAEFLLMSTDSSSHLGPAISRDRKEFPQRLLNEFVIVF
jgi:hypothetical protein